MTHQNVIVSTLWLADSFHVSQSKYRQMTSFTQFFWLIQRNLSNQWKKTRLICDIDCNCQQSGRGGEKLTKLANFDIEKKVALCTKSVERRKCSMRNAMLVSLFGIGVWHPLSAENRAPGVFELRRKACLLFLASSWRPSSAKLWREKSSACSIESRLSIRD